MAKVIFQLPGYYEGIRARRIKQSGRLWLVRVVSDPDKRDGSTFKPYWFVLIKGFDLVKDKASGATSIGVWRFGYEDGAFAKFEELRPLYPPYVKREPTPAQIAHRNRVRLHGIPKIYKEIPGTVLSKAPTQRGDQMSVFDTGPPGPEMVTPRLDTGAALENTDDDSAYIVPPKADDKPNPRKAHAALSAEEMAEWLGRHITCREEEITSRKGGICP